MLVALQFVEGGLCAGGSIDFQWNGNSAVWQTATSACPATFVNGTAARPLIAPTVGSGGVKSLYLPVPGNVHPHLPPLRLPVYMFHCWLAGPMLKLRSVRAQPTSRTMCQSSHPVPQKLPFTFVCESGSADAS